MSFISHFFHSFLHGASHTIIEKNMEDIRMRMELHKSIHGESVEERAWKFELEKMNEFKADKKNLNLHKQLSDCISKNNIPIEILLKHLYFVIYFCIKNGRQDLVQVYLPYYNERTRNFKKIKILNGIIFVFETLIPFLFRLAIFLIIILIFYSIFVGTPQWML